MISSTMGILAQNVGKVVVENKVGHTVAGMLEEVGSHNLKEGDL